MNYEDVMKLALERGFYFPSCEVYGDAHAGFWEYGPTGVGLKNKFLELWRRELIRRDGMLEIDGSQIMSKSVFEASGHLGSFSDPIIKCTNCKSTFRADRTIADISNIEIPESADLIEFDNAIKENKIKCPKCKGEFENTKKFNMMFRVGIGPEEEEAYLRPETCQSIFVDFPRLFKIMRGKLPMGIAQVGKSFRNEIAPRQSLLRLREFYQAEIEVFCNPTKLDIVENFSEIQDTVIRLQTDSEPIAMTCKEAVEKGVVPNKFVAYYLGILNEFYEKTGIDVKKSRFRKLGEKEKAFYAEVAFDFEVETTIGWLELVACNYRSDYDLSSHAKKSKEKFEVMDNDENDGKAEHEGQRAVKDLPARTGAFGPRQLVYGYPRNEGKIRRYQGQDTRRKKRQQPGEECGTIFDLLKHGCRVSCNGLWETGHLGRWPERSMAGAAVRARAMTSKAMVNNTISLRKSRYICPLAVLSNEKQPQAISRPR